MSNWQPIETAPKDGTLFLCWVDAVECCEDEEGGYFESDASAIDFCAWNAGDGVVGYYQNMMGKVGDYQDITHWMPLPAPPLDEEAQRTWPHPDGFGGELIGPQE